VCLRDYDERIYDMKVLFVSYRDLEELMMIRDMRVDHATLQRWVKRFSPLMDKRVRNRKKTLNGKVGVWTRPIVD
jgi:transposase-like protein